MLLASVAIGCAAGRTHPASDYSWGEGMASFYGPGLEGHTTASGELLDSTALRAAHRKLPFGTCVHVVNLRNGLAVDVRVNDRGPYAGNRVIDLTVAAARQLGMMDTGIARVRLGPCAQ